MTLLDTERPSTTIGQALADKHPEYTQSVIALERLAEKMERNRIRRKFGRYRTIIAAHGLTLAMLDSILEEPRDG